MDKAHIILEIQRTAQASGGKPLGRERFERETGIKESAWLGKFWTRWSDAVREAGFSPNEMNRPHPLEELLRPLAAFAIELGRFPTQPELNLKKRNDPSFPSPDSIRRRLGNKKDVIAARLLEFCNANTEFSDAIPYCRPHIKEERNDSPCDEASGLLRLS